MTVSRPAVWASAPREERGWRIRAVAGAALILLAGLLTSCETNDPFDPGVYSTDHRPLQARVVQRIQDQGFATQFVRPIVGATGLPVQIWGVGDDGGAPFCTTEGKLLLETVEEPRVVVHERDLVAEPLCGDRWYLWDGERFSEREEGRLPPPQGAYGLE